MRTAISILMVLDALCLAITDNKIAKCMCALGIVFGVIYLAGMGAT